MRAIKFRAKRLKDVRWIYGDVRHHKDDVCIFEQGGTKGEQVKRETIGQFTGLRDEFGKEAYEGDIIMLDGSPELGNRVIVYYEEAFNLATKKEYDYLQKGEHPYMNDYAHMTCLNEWSNTGLVRVIGNIHDNPELLKKD